jgi:hypothetical protein
MEICFLASCGCRTLPAIPTRVVDFASNNRFYALRFHRIVKRDSAEHVAVIGDGARAHAQFWKALRQWFDLGCSVKQTKISVKMQVYELFFTHLCGAAF